MRWSLGMMIAAITVACLPAAAQDDPRQSPYFAVPALRQLMEWATFQLTFDAASMVPDLAGGAAQAGLQGTPQFAPGLRGQALVAGKGSGIAVYPGDGNATFTTQGALALWLCPVSWTHTLGDNTTMVMTTNSSFYVQRQGPWVEGTVLKRAEGLQYLVFSKTAGNQCLMHGTNDWPVNQWRLFVVNWTWPTMSCSLDGGELASVTLKGKPAPEEFGGIVVGANGGEKTLLDEITFFRRPLALAEVKALYNAFKPQ